MYLIPYCIINELLWLSCGCWSFNPLAAWDAANHHGTWSTFVQIMAWCLMVPIHYLNQCWYIITRVCGDHLRDILQRMLKILISNMSLKKSVYFTSLPYLPWFPCTLLLYFSVSGELYTVIPCHHHRFLRLAKRKILIAEQYKIHWDWGFNKVTLIYISNLFSWMIVFWLKFQASLCHIVIRAPFQEWFCSILIQIRWKFHSPLT